MRSLLIRLIRFYQRLPFRHLSRCRYLPTCSDYAAEAIHEWGPGKGTLLAAKRIVRCNPFGGSGFDPVPCRSPETSRHEL